MMVFAAYQGQSLEKGGRLAAYLSLTAVQQVLDSRGCVKEKRPYLPHKAMELPCTALRLTAMISSFQPGSIMGIKYRVA